MSDVGGEVGEMDEIFGSMKEARDDLVKAKFENRIKHSEKEEKKERLGTLIRQRATQRRKSKLRETINNSC